MSSPKSSPSRSSAPARSPAQQEVLAVVNAGRTRRRLGGVFTVLLLVLAVLGGGYFYWRQATAAPKPTQFVTVPVALGDLQETVTATGTLSPVGAVELGAEVTGRLTRVLVDVNDHVEAGQVLAEIDPEQLSARVKESRAQVGGAAANIASAKATLAEAELKATRVKALGERELVSREEVEAAEAALARAKAALASANAQLTVVRAGLTSAETSLERATIIAPISGIVLMRAIEPGQTVTAGFQTPVLFTLARDLTSLELNVEVDEADIGKVKQGQTATFVVDAYPDREFKSKLVQLHNLPKAEATVVTYQAVLLVDNSDLLLRPGMTATATVVTRELKQQLLVENRALRFEPPQQRASRGFFRLPGFGGKPRGGGARSAPVEPSDGKRVAKEAVFVVRGPGRVQRAPVTVLATDGLQSAVTSESLQVGDAVAVDVADESEP